MTGFGILELKPKEFWPLTPFDIDDLTDGYDGREKVRKQNESLWDSRIGWIISWLLTPHLGKGKTLLPEKCTPKWKMKKDNKKSPFESRNELKKLKKDFKNGKRRNN